MSEIKKPLSIYNPVSKCEWWKQGIASNRLGSGFNLSTNNSIFKSAVGQDSQD